MYFKSVLFCIWSLHAYLCVAKFVELPLNVKELSPDLYDDIRLTPEQQREKNERGFITFGKWPKAGGVVTVPYYFDTAFFPAGDIFRDKFKQAIEVYKNQTCIEWVEVTKTDTRHKVRLFKESGCWSYIGMIGGAEQDLSLDDGCHETGTILHEVGHCMGLFHTQSRPDRDQYVKPWLQYVRSGMENNFDISDGETFNIPYDYKSMMHYGSSYFSINGSFTLTTLDPFALFAIGARSSTFRYSDAAFLNNGYSCIADFTAKCGEKKCENGGFVGKDCICRCPENTSGDTCGTVTGLFFSDKPTCGGEVTAPREIVPNGYPTASTTEKCMFAIRAPTCQLPAITFTEAKFYWTSCGGNKLSLQISPTWFGYNWCNANNIPLGNKIVSETQNASIFYYTGAKRFPNIGFKAIVEFVDDPNCSTVNPTGFTTTHVSSTTSTASSTTTTRTTTTTTTITRTTTTTTTITRTTTTTTRPTTTTRTTTTTTRPTTTTRTTTTTTRPTTTTRTTTTTTTMAPSFSCSTQEIGGNNITFQTENFPNRVLPGTICSLGRSPASTVEMIFYRLNIDFQGSRPDSFEIKDPIFITKYLSATRTTQFALWPMSITFNASSSIGKGFKVSAATVAGLPSPCNGEKVVLSDGEKINISNPLLKNTTTFLSCAFLIEVPAGKQVIVKPLVNKVGGSERLKIASSLPTYDYFYDIQTDSITASSNLVKVYYVGGKVYGDWLLEVTSV